MNYIFVKVGERQPSPHDDFIELVNYREDVPATTFWNLTPPGLRLIHNNTETAKQNLLAIAHYTVVPSIQRQSPTYHMPIDTALLLRAANQYEYVMACILTPIQHTAAEQVLHKMQYVARDAEGRLIDVATYEVIDETIPYATTMLFGFMRLQGLPMYYMIPNVDFVHVTDTVDLLDLANDALWVGVTPTDGSLAERILTPVVNGAVAIDNTIITASSEFEIDMFGGETSFFRGRDRSDLLRDAKFSLVTNLSCNVSNSGLIKVKVPVDIKAGYIDLTLNCGTFFTVASKVEQLRVKFVILRTKS